MMESLAYRVLSLSAHRCLSRLEIELGHHGGKPEENGSLIVTFEDFVEYGVERHAIARAIRELVALGFIEVTRKGSAGNAGFRQAQRYLLTHHHSGSDVALRDGWKRIKTIEEAEQVATNARSRSSGNTVARAFGRKGGIASQLQKQKSSAQKPTNPSAQKPTDGNLNGWGKPTDGPVRKNPPPLSKVSLVGPAREPEPDPVPPVGLGLWWSPPRCRELDPASDEPIEPWSPQGHPVAQVTLH
jgi:hypothetical protein